VAIPAASLSHRAPGNDFWVFRWAARETRLLRGNGEYPRRRLHRGPATVEALHRRIRGRVAWGRRPPGLTTRPDHPATPTARMPSTSSSAQLARKHSADRLRRIRRDAGSPAGRWRRRPAGTDQSVEAGAHCHTPTLDDLKTWCRICQRRGVIANLTTRCMLRTPCGWTGAGWERTGLAPAQTIGALPVRTNPRVPDLLSVMIPGPVQTVPMSGLSSRHPLSARHRRRTLKRRSPNRPRPPAHVHEGEHRFNTVLEEATLRTSSGSGGDGGQLGHLLSVASLPSSR